MQEKVEFKGIKIPEKNPNRPNDIYKNNGSEYALLQLICLLTASIIATIVCVGFWIYSLRAVLSPEGRADDYWGFAMLGVCVVACFIWIRVNVKDLYQLYGYRKKIIANGKAYPGVVGEVQEYTRKGSAGLYGSVTWKKFSMEIKYAEDSFWISGMEADPRECLENPYCTVYVWEGKAIATDFKLREAYISKNGKTYSSKAERK